MIEIDGVGGGCVKSRPPWVDRLDAQGACGSAMLWVQQFGTAEAAWKACDRAEWLLWCLAHAAGGPGTGSNRRLVGCLVDCLMGPGACGRLFEILMPVRDLEAARNLRAYAAGRDEVPTGWFLQFWEDRSGPLASICHVASHPASPRCREVDSVWNKITRREALKAIRKWYPRPPGAMDADVVPAFASGG